MYHSSLSSCFVKLTDFKQRHASSALQTSKQKALSHQTQHEKVQQNESYLGKMYVFLCAKQMHHVESAVVCLCIFVALFKFVLKKNFCESSC